MILVHQKIVQEKRFVSKSLNNIPTVPVKVKSEEAIELRIWPYQSSFCGLDGILDHFGGILMSGGMLGDTMMSC